MPESAASESAAAPFASSRDATLDFLLRRMRHRSDFPALSESVARILRTADSEDESLADLTHEILKDVALTHKLLRLVNSVQFAHLGQGTISTVSRAVSLVGFNTVRTMALSLVLLDHMQDKAHAQQMKEEFVRALLAGAVAVELSTVSRDSEGAFLGAMFQNLGRMLACFYFQEEAEQIRQLAAAPDFVGGEDTAAAQVLGIDYQDLAAGVARTWGLPEALRRAMRRPDGPAPSKLPDEPLERMRWVGAVANDVAGAMMESSDAADLVPRLREAARHYAGLLAGQPAGSAQKALAVAATEARRKTIAMTGAMDLQLDAASPASRVLEPEQPASEAGGAVATPQSVQAMREAYAQARTARVEATARPPGPPPAAEQLSAGVQDIVDAMAGTFRIDDILRMVLETMFRSLGLQRVVFCLRDASGKTLKGRIGMGEAQEQAVKALQVPLDATGDLFAAACLKGADLFIADATDPRTAPRLPAWYRTPFADAGAFLLLPLSQKGRPFGLIYADHATPGSLALSDREFALLRTLRNQALMALRQSA